MLYFLSKRKEIILLTIPSLTGSSSNKKISSPINSIKIGRIILMELLVLADRNVFIYSKLSKLMREMWLVIKDIRAKFLFWFREGPKLSC